jgi:hypothetical protein
MAVGGVKERRGEVRRSERRSGRCDPIQLAKVSPKPASTDKSASRMSWLGVWDGIRNYLITAA